MPYHHSLATGIRPQQALPPTNISHYLKSPFRRLCRGYHSLKRRIEDLLDPYCDCDRCRLDMIDSELEDLERQHLPFRVPGPHWDDLPPAYSPPHDEHLYYDMAEDEYDGGPHYQAPTYFDAPEAQPTLNFDRNALDFDALEAQPTLNFDMNALEFDMNEQVEILDLLHEEVDSVRAEIAAERGRMQDLRQQRRVLESMVYPRRGVPAPLPLRWRPQTSPPAIPVGDPFSDRRICSLRSFVPAPFTEEDLLTVSCQEVGARGSSNPSSLPNTANRYENIFGENRPEVIES